MTNVHIGRLLQIGLYRHVTYLLRFTALLICYQWRLKDLVAGASGIATCKVEGQVLRSSVSFKTILKPLKTRTVQPTIYLHEAWGVGGGSLFPLGERSAVGAMPPPRKFFDFSVENGAFWCILGAIIADCNNLKFYWLNFLPLFWEGVIVPGTARRGRIDTYLSYQRAVKKSHLHVECNTII